MDDEVKANMKRDTVMPDQVQLGQQASTPIFHAIHRWQKGEPEECNPLGKRTVMGFPLPDWQRPLVWTEEQQVRFLESAWLGLPLGTYTYNQIYHPREYDGLLIDGQQRLYAIERYLRDEFPVFGYLYSQTTVVDKRLFDMIPFHCFITKSTDEQYLRSYYNLMNFGGTAHTEDQRA